MKSLNTVVLAFAFLSSSAVLGLTLEANVQAQEMNPAYLSQFPSVERVKAEIKGSDPIDTVARQQQAFWLLNQMIPDLAGQRFDNDEMTRAEESLRSKYGEAFQWYQYKERAPAPQDQTRWRKLLEFYEKDPGFLDELLRRFFSPQFRAGYYRATGKQAPQLSGSNPGALPTRPAALPNTSTGGGAKDYEAQGDKYFKAEDYAKALEAYKKATALDTSRVGSYYGIASAASFLGDHQARIAAMKQVTILTPNDADAFFTLGSFCNTARQYKEAVPALLQSLRLKPNNALALNALAFSYFGLGQHSEAIAAEKQSIRMEPNFAKAHQDLGNMYVFLKRYPEAVAELETAIRLTPSSLSYKGLGMAYARMGRKDDALRVYRKLLTLDKKMGQELLGEINNAK